jgi:hypothetical protein
MTGLAFLLVVFIVGIILSVRLLLSWHHQDASILRSKRRHSIVIPVVLLLYLGLAAGLWYMGPIANHRSLGILAMSAPDQMLLLGSDVALALLGAALQLVSLYSIFRPRSR